MDFDRFKAGIMQLGWTALCFFLALSVAKDSNAFRPTTGDVTRRIDSANLGFGGVNEVLPTLINQSYDSIEGMNQGSQRLRDRCREEAARLVPLDSFVRTRNYRVRSPLFKQARGFASTPVKQSNNTTSRLTGGSHGFLHIVTNSANDGPGTLRCLTEHRPHVLDAPEAFENWEVLCARIAILPLHIIFHTTKPIVLDTPLKMSSYKTIDGRGGAGIRIHGAPIQIDNVQNVVLTNLNFDGNDTYSTTRGTSATPGDRAAISIAGSARHVWIHRSDFTGKRGRQIVINDLEKGNSIQSPTTVSITNSKFTNAERAIQIGHGTENRPKDRSIFVTIWENEFKDNADSDVSVSNARVHLMRNRFTKSKGTAVSVKNAGELVAEHNAFIVEPSVKSFSRMPASKEHPSGQIQLHNNRRLLGESFPVITLEKAASKKVFTPNRYYIYELNRGRLEAGYKYEPNPLMHFKAGTPIRNQFDQMSL